MSDGMFVLDPRLAADTHPVASLPLCDVLLMNDMRYLWLVMVPRRAGMVEVMDLPDEEQMTMWREVRDAGNALRTITSCEKLNIGALGNVVRQLHVHVVARHSGDAAWPGPVWGLGKAEAYDLAVHDELVERLCRSLAYRAIHK